MARGGQGSTHKGTVGREYTFNGAGAAMQGTGAMARAFQGFDVTVLPNPLLYMLPRSLWDNLKQFSGLTAAWVPLAASASTPVNTSVPNDCIFVILSLQATVRDAATGLTVVTASPFTIQVQDQGSNVNLFDQPTDFLNVVGTGASPCYLSLPRIVKKGATLATTITNLDTVNAFNIRLVFGGFKVFGMKLNPADGFDNY